jgi:signal transduction histidine kinase
MLGRLEEAFDRQQRFLADASHELRTPVAALLTAIEIALRYPRDAQAYREALDSCRADAAFLCQLVERLFEQVRSQLPDLEEMPEPVDVATFLGQCADTVEPLAQTAGVELQRHWVAKHGQRPWVTQRGRLRSIVVNLLNNAVEHAPAGSAVEMFCAMADDALYLAVRDQGPGIPPEHLPHVFEPFYRVDKSRSRAAGHLGLGLALVHTHVEAMRGRCQVQNAHPGTIFEVVLPMK